jgi:hypothetical protein
MASLRHSEEIIVGLVTEYKRSGRSNQNSNERLCGVAHRTFIRWQLTIEKTVSESDIYKIVTRCNMILSDDLENINSRLGVHVKFILF